jgi:hypothetical protein
MPEEDWPKLGLHMPEEDWPKLSLHMPEKDWPKLGLQMPEGDWHKLSLHMPVGDWPPFSKNEWVIAIWCQLSNLSTISWLEQVNIHRGDDKVRFVLCC